MLLYHGSFLSHIQAEERKHKNLLFCSLHHVHLLLLILWQVRKRVKLEGKELEEYLEKEKVKKEAAKKLEQAKE